MFRRHKRFLIAMGLGALVALLVPGSFMFRLIAGIDAFCLIYLVLMVTLVRGMTAQGLREHAGDTDEGVHMIAVLAVIIVVASLAAVFMVLQAEQHSIPPAHFVLAFAGLPLGWAMLHTVAAFHYAQLFYGPQGSGGAEGGLAFPGTAAPGVFDFLYYAFTIGMAAQVSDTDVTNTPMRKATLAHALLSYGYNAVILALAVNAVVTLG
jgi:uncharacterized membrane protein